MDTFGINYDTILTYVQHHCPWALPYIQFILYCVPGFLFVFGWIADRLPAPNYQISEFSDATIAGKLDTKWFAPIDKLVKSGNQVIILLNYILSTRVYLLVYLIICALGRRMRKMSDAADRAKATLTKQGVPAPLCDLEQTHVNADDLTPDQIRKRARLLSTELTKAQTKDIRAVAAQRTTQFDKDAPLTKASTLPPVDAIIPVKAEATVPATTPAQETPQS